MLHIRVSDSTRQIICDDDLPPTVCIIAPIGWEIVTRKVDPAHLKFLDYFAYSFRAEFVLENKIKVIKLIKDHFNVGLVEAKQVYDSWVASRPIYNE